MGRKSCATSPHRPTCWSRTCGRRAREPARPRITRARALNPRLVYCSITGFGQDGPGASLPGYDFVVQALGGLMSMTGERDDLPGGGPQKAGVAITDLMTGMYATVAIQAALAHRDRTGQGQWIDACLLDSAVALMATRSAQLSDHRHAARAHRQRAPEHRPLQRLRLRRRAPDPRRRQRCPVREILRSGGEDGMGDGSAIREERRPRTQPRHARSAGCRRCADAIAARVAGRAGAPRHPVRADQPPGSGVRGPAGRRAWPADGSAASARGWRASGAIPAPVFRDAARIRPPAAASGEHTAAVLRERLGMGDDAIDALARRNVIQV